MILLEESSVLVVAPGDATAWGAVFALRLDLLVADAGDVRSPVGVEKVAGFLDIGVWGDISVSLLIFSELLEEKFDVVSGEVSATYLSHILMNVSI